MPAKAPGVYGLIALLLCSLAQPLFSQESAAAEPDTVTAEPVPAAAEPEAAGDPSPARHCFFVTAGPVLLVNTDSASAPSPIMFSCGFGASLWETSAVTLQTRLSFFTNYYLWDNEKAHPAELENRTAHVLSALGDFCAVRTVRRGGNLIQAGGGAAVLARFAFVANDVSSDEAGDDVSNIQRWLWSDLRWLYPEFCVSWTHRLPESRLCAGLEARFYLPLGSIIAGDGLNAAIASLACKLSL